MSSRQGGEGAEGHAPAAASLRCSSSQFAMHKHSIACCAQHSAALSWTHIGKGERGGVVERKGIGAGLWEGG